MPGARHTTRRRRDTKEACDIFICTQKKSASRDAHVDPTIAAASWGPHPQRPRVEHHHRSARTWCGGGGPRAWRAAARRLGSPRR